MGTARTRPGREVIHYSEELALKICDLLIDWLTQLQDQEQALRLQHQDAQRRALEAKLRRPEVPTVQAIWKQFLAVWEAATDEERTQLMPMLVERVTLTEKGRGRVRLSFQANDPRSENGSGASTRFVSDRTPAPNQIQAAEELSPAAFQLCSS